jgi:cytidylate kinase
VGQGIVIAGLNGSGKSTLAHALAKTIHYYEMDVEDYYFPEQKASRQIALDHCDGAACRHLGALPFSRPREKSDVQRALLDDIHAHPRFILASVTMNWCEEILSQVCLAVLLEAPVEERVHRIQEREKARFGDRVLAGGDMFEQQQVFCNTLARRSGQVVQESMSGLSCPVIGLDGMQAVSRNVEKVIRYRNSMNPSGLLPDEYA